MSKWYAHGKVCMYAFARVASVTKCCGPCELLRGVAKHPPTPFAFHKANAKGGIVTKPAKLPKIAWLYDKISRWQENISFLSHCYPKCHIMRVFYLMREQ